MGKPTGFLEYERENGGSTPPKERIQNFCEFHTHLSRENNSFKEPDAWSAECPFVSLE